MSLAGSALPEQGTSLLTDLRGAPEELWRHRELAYQLALRDVKVRYKQSLMGFAWALLMPGMVILAGTLVRYAMAHIAGGAVDTRDIAAVAVKAVPWSFFVSAVGFASVSLSGNAALITKIYFPREVLPLAAVAGHAFDAVVASVVVVGAVTALGLAPDGAWLWAPVLLGVLLLFTAGAALLLSAATLFFRDVKYLVQVGLTFGIFFTPVFVEPAMLGARGARLMMLNPLAPLLEGLRLAIVEGWNLAHPLTVVSGGGASVLAWTPWDLAYAAGCAAVLAACGLLVFRLSESRFAEYA